MSADLNWFLFEDGDLVMQSMLMAWVFAVLVAMVAPELNADAVSDVNRGLDSADRTMQGVESTTERSKNLFDRIKGWFKKNAGSAKPDPLVREVQQQLASLGYDPGPVDGVVGPQTLDAIVRFQQSRGLPVDARVTDELAQLLRSITVVAPSTPTQTTAPVRKQSDADILIALQYSSGADVHHLRCSGSRSSQFRDEFLKALSTDKMMQFAANYDDEFVRQYGEVSDCQPQVAEWLAGMHRQKLARLNQVAASGSTSLSPYPQSTPGTSTTTHSTAASSVPLPPSSALADVNPAAQTEGTAAAGPPLSNPQAGPSSNLVLNTPTTVPEQTPAVAVDPVLIGAWAWIHPQQGIIAFVNVGVDRSFQMESLGQEKKGGTVETQNGVLRLIAHNAEDSKQFNYQQLSPDEINLVNAAGEKTVLLRNKVQ
ncbi:MAG: peptidoglycan-binding domain-containing protein [Arenicellales bacterium]|nr:peptidoglycan-binding domain-containing protein [Arenicellales bacterium]